jgi:hypothetical protein
MTVAEVWAALNKHGIHRQETGPWVFEWNHMIHISGQDKAACEIALTTERIVYLKEDNLLVIRKKG